eukprot:TRINITY_DN15786_c0_g1_i5.p2 TRINITY_DN15786_c0_g1~~TRINITY_DN15786_c0_g1_i5.p2  ORF type:complete len:208 (+),score=-9.64 TRINITY_DN15786_c0_g1_i5:169-792(+)
MNQSRHCRCSQLNTFYFLLLSTNQTYQSNYTTNTQNYHNQKKNENKIIKPAINVFQLSYSQLQSNESHLTHKNFKQQKFKKLGQKPFFEKLVIYIECFNLFTTVIFLSQPVKNYTFKINISISTQHAQNIVKHWQLLLMFQKKEKWNNYNNIITKYNKFHLLLQHVQCTLVNQIPHKSKQTVNRFSKFLGKFAQITKLDNTAYDQKT